MPSSLLPSKLDYLDDQELQRLVMLWRSHAAHGSAEARGIAHAFEAEQQRRKIFARHASHHWHPYQRAV